MTRRLKYAWRLLFGKEPYLLVFAEPQKHYLVLHNMKPDQLNDLVDLMEANNIETEIEAILNE